MTMIRKYDSVVPVLPSPSSMETVYTEAEVEAEATRWRAVHGVVPYFVWSRLTDDARNRISVLTQERARRVLRLGRES